MKRFIYYTFLILLINLSTYGETIYALSGSRTDIQSAVNQAKDGDTIIIPSGSYSFNGTVRIIDKDIYIKGAGINNTILRKTGTSSSNKEMFEVYMHGKKGITFSDFKLVDIYGPYSQTDSSQYTIGIRLKYGVWNFRVHDMEFEGFGFAGVRCEEYSGTDPSVTWWKQRGVIYDCRFIDCFMPGVGYGVSVFGGNEKNWMEPLDLGSAWFVFVEDCYFENCRHCVTSGYGARYVARYNTINGNRDNARSIDAHGYDSKNDTHATRAWEIYENDIILYGTSGGGIGVSGGDGVIWNNTLNGAKDGCYIRLTSSIVPPECSYPCTEQIRDSYIWGNIKDGAIWNVTVLSEEQDIIQENRYYYEYEKPGYVPYAYPHPLRQYAPISLSAIASHTLGGVPLTVDFNAIVSGGLSPYIFIWDFGDGQSSDIQNPSHTYISEGTYSVTLKVTDASNTPEWDALTIEVTSTPVFQLSISATTNSIASNVGGVTDPPLGNHNYYLGTSIQVKAIPTLDYRFSNWSGDLSDFNRYYESFSLNMNSNKSLVANFCAKCGDINGDLIISGSDAQAAFDMFLKKYPSPTFCEKENADVDCNGTREEPTITPADAQAIFVKFIKGIELPSDCSGENRSQSTATIETQIRRNPERNLIVDENRYIIDEFLFVPIIIDNAFNLKAFGFDLQFHAESLDFIRLENTEFSNTFDKIGANQIDRGLIRVGGYAGSPVVTKSPEVLVTLVFRIRKKENEPFFLSIINAFDDLKRDSLKYDKNIRYGSN
jgi:PKD repeat protein